MCYPARLLGSLLCCVPVGASRCFLGSVALLVVLGWTLLVLSFGSSLCPFCFPLPAVCPVWCPHLVFAGTSLWVSGCSFCACLFFVCVVFWFCFCVVVSLCCVFCCLMNVTVHRTMYQSSTSLLLRPLQSRPLRDLITN